MTRTDRRRFLAGVATALGSVAGCTSTKDETHLENDELSVNNWDDEPHRVHVAVVDDDEINYWNSLLAEPFDPEQNEAGGGSFGDLPPVGGTRLYARVDATVRSVNFDAGQYDGRECVSAEVAIEGPGAGLREDSIALLTSEC